MTLTDERRLSFAEEVLPAIRAALPSSPEWRMEPAREWTGRQATALRKALRLTTEAFAARVGVAPRSVANWAAHPDIVPRNAIQALLDDLAAQLPPPARSRFEGLAVSGGSDPAGHGEALRVEIAIVVDRDRVLTLDEAERLREVLDTLIKLGRAS